MKTTRLASLVVVPLALTAAGCANVASLLDDPRPETTTEEPAAALADGLVLAAVDSVSPDACPEGDDTALAMSSRTADDTIQCVFIVPDEAIEVASGEIEEIPATTDMPEPTLQVSLDSAGAEALASLTGDLVERTPPQNQIAIVVDDEVISAPTVLSAITDGVIQISGENLEGLYEELSG